MRNSRPQIGPSRSVREQLVLNALLVENLLEEVRRTSFVAGRIRGVDPQIFPLPLDREIGVLLQAIWGMLSEAKQLPGGSSLGPTERCNHRQDEP